MPARRAPVPIRSPEVLVPVVTGTARVQGSGGRPDERRISDQAQRRIVGHGDLGAAGGAATVTDPRGTAKRGRAAPVAGVQNHRGAGLSGTGQWIASGIQEARGRAGNKTRPPGPGARLPSLPEGEGRNHGQRVVRTADRRARRPAPP
jgi:hypothetical protein